MLGGRGAGKTRAGAEWVRGMMSGDPMYTASPIGRMALVGETYAAVRDVMIEGESGILAVHPNPRAAKLDQLKAANCLEQWCNCAGFHFRRTGWIAWTAIWCSLV